MPEAGWDVVHSAAGEKVELPTEEGCFILEAWNDASDPSVSIARARVPAGQTTQLHRLCGVVERYLVIAGKGLARAGDRRDIPLSVGDVLVIPAGAPQRVEAIGEEDFLFYCVCTPRFTPECYEVLE